MAQPPSIMSPVKVPRDLPSLVRKAFRKARDNGDLIYYPTHAALLDVNSVPFQLRFSPSLANKPKAPSPVTAVEADPLNPSVAPSKRPAFDPFDNPPPGLLVAQLPPSHFLVLNKFAIVPEHFILATTAFKEQTHLLEEEDLAATLACIEEYHSRCELLGQGGWDAFGELFAFFNSGPHSGASQPHRHVQLLPVERMSDGLDEEVQYGGGSGTKRWEVLADRLVEGDTAKQLPFRTFAERIRPGIDAEELHGVYLGLYRRACAAVLRGSGMQEDETGADDQVDGEAKISYNMAMTRDVIVILPRLAEGTVITAGGHSKDTAAGGSNVIGKLALNGTVLAGTALVKSQAEWDFLRSHPESVVDLLGGIGVSPSQSKV